jgi:hypothetical protein
MDSFFGLFFAALAVWFLITAFRNRADKRKSAAARAAPVAMPSMQDPRYFRSSRIVALKHGSHISLGVNTQHCSHEATTDLLGQPQDHQFINRSVRVFIARDDQSPHANSVKVLTATGNPVGWVLDSDTTMACTIVDTLNTELRKLDASVVNEQFVFEVLAHVEGEWSHNNNQWTAQFHVLDIGLKDPVQADY